jgi:hypothetical protein
VSESKRLTDCSLVAVRSVTFHGQKITAGTTRISPFHEWANTRELKGVFVEATGARGKAANRSAHPGDELYGTTKPPSAKGHTRPSWSL